MVANYLARRRYQALELLASKQFNESTFYPALIKDLKNCGSELIIGCPFATCRRLSMLLPILEKLKARKVHIAVNTRDPQMVEDEYKRRDTHDAISKLQHMGVHVLYTGNHHRKLVIIDRRIFS